VTLPGGIGPGEVILISRIDRLISSSAENRRDVRRVAVTLPV
jgi:hypothetical protein